MTLGRIRFREKGTQQLEETDIKKNISQMFEFMAFFMSVHKKSQKQKHL